MKYEAWDFENNVVETKRPLMFPAKTAENYMGSAYAVETEKGIFYQKMRPDGKFNLMLVDKQGERIFEEDIVVVASDIKYTCIIVHYERTGEFILIDTRGDLFLLEVNIERTNPAMYSMRLDRKTGFYNVGFKEDIRWLIRAVDKKKQFLNAMNSAADDTAELNPKYKTIFKKSDVQYLYLTILNSKKGKLIDYLIQNVLPYEELPNVFVDDTSRNIRIPINEVTLAKKEMHFLLEKYNNSYVINGIGLDVILGTLDVDYKIKNQLYFCGSSASETQHPKVVSIISTLKQALGYETDLELYKKFVKKFIDVFPQIPNLNYTNEFGKLLLPYPESGGRGAEINREELKKKSEYIEMILGKSISNIDTLDIAGITMLYREAYDKSKKFYKEELKKFEESIISLLK